MTTKSKSVILKDFNPYKFKPDKGINVAWKKIDEKNREWAATFYGSDKANSPKEVIYKHDINNQLSNLSKNLLSDRVRTIRKPQYNIVGSRKELIQ